MKTTKTQKVLQDMLTENTGRHMLDSGGAYGRNWERNQGIDFQKTRPVLMRFDKWRGDNWELEYTQNVYHFLDDRLEFDSSMDGVFNRYVKKVDPNDDQSWFELAEGFADYLDSLPKYNGLVTGLEGSGKPFTVNTYNGEDNLSQVIQYVYFEVDDSPYVLLSIHGGCDVRGGYTKPRVFKVGNDYSLFDNAQGYITCDCPDCRANWSTDDTYHWYEDGGSRGRNLEKFSAYNEDDIEGFIALEELKRDGVIDFDHMARTYGTPERFILINEDHTAICPICGKGTLRA